MEDLTDQEVVIATHAIREWAMNQRARGHQQLSELGAAPFYRRADDAEDVAIKMEATR
jgi:hypothetical protein